MTPGAHTSVTTECSWGQILFLARLSSPENTLVQETRSDPTADRSLY